MRKLFVFSADALVYEDMQLLKTLPNFKRFLSGGASIKRVKSIYPTITYPVHTTVMTGVYPDKHGIVLNGGLEIGNNDWNWFHSSCKWQDDIFANAKKAGLSTAAVFWPVTGNHKYIDYLIDEYWTQSVNDNPHDAFKRSGSSDEVLEIIDSKLPLLKERKHPYADDFVVGCSCEIIKKFKPDVMLIHPANIDAYRHSYGVFNDKVELGVYETDKWIGDICTAMIEAGTFDETDFFLISDHGALDIKRVVSLNTFLADAGLIKLDGNGKITDKDAYIFSGGLCAYCKVYNHEKYNDVFDLLHKLEAEGVYGIGKVFTSDETEKLYHLDGDFDFVLETDGFTSFSESCVRPLVKNFDFNDYRYGKATHGHLPEKGPQPTLACKGSGIASNTVIETTDIVNLAPTFSALLGIDLPCCDGKVITEILN